jgi:hypothetical protein
VGPSTVAKAHGNAPRSSPRGDCCIDWSSIQNARAASRSTPAKLKLSVPSATMKRMTDDSTSYSSGYREPKSLAELAHDAQVRWAKLYVNAHRKRRVISWAIAIVLDTHVSLIIFRLDVWDSLFGRGCVALLAWLLPVQFIISADSRRRSDTGSAAWSCAWASLLAEAVLGLELFASGRDAAGVEYVLAVVAIGGILAYGLHVPLDPSIDWNEVFDEQLTAVRTADGGRVYDDVITDDRKAEEVGAAWMRRFGYTDARVTPPGPDNGIDGNSQRAVGQVKYWTTKRVGIKDVQRLPGAAVLGQASFFFAAHGYTRAVLQWAENPEHRVALFRMEPSGHLIACNYRARRALWLAKPFPSIPTVTPPPGKRRAVREIAFCLMLGAAILCYGWTAYWVIATHRGVKAEISIVGLAACMLVPFISIMARPIASLAGDARRGRRPGVWKAFTPVPRSQSGPEEHMPSGGFMPFERGPVLRALIAINDARIYLRALRRICRL